MNSDLERSCPCNRGVLHPHKHPTKKSQLSNIQPNTHTTWKVYNLHTHNCNFHLHSQSAYKNHTWIFGKTYKYFRSNLYPLNLQVATKKKKNLIVYMVSNANFLPCCNGYFIRKITNIIEIMSEHHTQVEMCG